VPSCQVPFGFGVPWYTIFLWLSGLCEITLVRPFFEFNASTPQLQGRYSSLTAHTLFLLPFSIPYTSPSWPQMQPPPKAAKSPPWRIRKRITSTGSHLPSKERTERTPANPLRAAITIMVGRATSTVDKHELMPTQGIHEEMLVCTNLP
jgi:hypothetical protein